MDPSLFKKNIIMFYESIPWMNTYAKLFSLTWSSHLFIYSISRALHNNNIAPLYHTKQVKSVSFVSKLRNCIKANISVGKFADKLLTPCNGLLFL